MEANTKELTRDVHGVRTTVCAPEWFSRHLVEPYLAAFGEHRERADRPVGALYTKILEPSLRTTASRLDVPHGGRLVGRDLRVGDGWAWWRDLSTEVLLRLDTPERWSVTGGLRLRPDQYLRMKLNAAYRLGLSQLALRHFVLFPLFELLTRTRNVQVWHGSALEHEGRALVFCGWNGVGKSQLAVELARHLGGRVITDNFVLYTGGRVLPFPEVLRLDPALASPPGFRLATKTAGLRVQGKNWHIATALDTDLSYPLAAAYYLVRGNRPRLEPLTRDRFCALLNGMHLSLGEFTEHSRWGVALQHLFADDRSNQRLVATKEPFDTALLDVGEHTPISTLTTLLNLRKEANRESCVPADHPSGAPRPTRELPTLRGSVHAPPPRLARASGGDGD